jgi:hypothetical protein
MAAGGAAVGAHKAKWISFKLRSALYIRGDLGGAAETGTETGQGR